MTTAVLIVAHNTHDDVVACVEALLASGAPADAIYVADNGSTDRTASTLTERFSGVHVLANPDNRYYARATNQLLETAQADYYLLLNPDTRPDFSALLTLLDRFDDLRVAAVAPQLRFPDGKVQPSCRRIPDWCTPWRELRGQGRERLSAWKMGDFDHRTPRRVEQPMFSCIWISRRATSAIGGLDPAYPLFFNDVDWCWRAREAGWYIEFDPRTVVCHALGGTTRRYPWRRLFFAHTGFARFLWRYRSGNFTGVVGVAGVWLAFPWRALGVLFQHE